MDKQAIIAGNTFDKYGSRNPLVQWMVSGFFSAAENLLEPHRNEILSVTEIGCGEGHLAAHLARCGYPDIKAFDVSAKIITQAAAIHQTIPVTFFTQSIYSFSKSESADLLVCCEVLEHLDDPDTALKIISQHIKKYALFSVPQEPLWRLLNMARGKYILNLGNTPGHINHWGIKEFENLLKPHFKIMETRTPFPWTMILVKPASLEAFGQQR
ncbi:MAG: class I SAM-dependent methyltransferase [Candidatus Omnitrophota bacterium]